MNRRSFLGSLLALPFIRSLTSAKAAGTPLPAATPGVIRLPDGTEVHLAPRIDSPMYDTPPRQWECFIRGEAIRFEPKKFRRQLRLVDRPTELAEGTQVRSTWSDEG